MIYLGNHIQEPHILLMDHTQFMPYRDILPKNIGFKKSSLARKFFKTELQIYDTVCFYVSDRNSVESQGCLYYKRAVNQ